LGKLVELLSPHERADYYRSRAAESLRHAVSVTDQDAKTTFVDNAARWKSLAVEVETFYQRSPASPTKRKAVRLIAQ